MRYKINGVFIKLEQDVIYQLNAYYQENTQYETGGILLGCIGDEGNVIVIREAYQIKSTWYSPIQYKRNAKKAQKIINKRWRETEGFINYVGEWHTHPNMRPLPSSIDKKSLYKITNCIDKQIPVVALLILGKDNETTLTVGRGQKIDALIFNR